MDLGLQGKVAMVAAASKGIGLAVAKALAAEGCHVSICARNEETLEAAAAEIGEETRSYVVDVANAEDLEWWLEQTETDLGRPSILVTNTGGPPAGALGEMTDEQWEQGFQSTFMNVVRLVRLVQPHMTAEGWGRIVHITSLVAKDPNPLLPISSTLRTGIVSLTRLQARELAPHGITVNGVLPGHTLTDRQTHLAEIRAGREGISAAEALERQGAAVPIGRLARPEEVAAAVAFLCGTPASYITGQSLLVDGGIVAGLG
ncbi:MAG: SDR family oxidoreductase [Fimbriimonas sp.]